jgi:serine protease Do
MDLTGLAADLRRITVELISGGQVAGSGVVWAPDWVVTNAHVASHAHVRLRRADGTHAEGRVVARDRDADLALLHVPGLDGHGATRAEAADVRIGSLVVAVGHPFGIRGALTAGIVHALGPLIRGGRSWVQADLRLAPGNSGGPLADVRGHVVGLNAIIAGALALAIPVSDVARFVASASPGRA